MTISPYDIEVRVAQLDAETLEAEGEAVRLSLPAVAGDAEAVERLAEVEATIVQYRADRETLLRARAGATLVANAEAARILAEVKEAALVRAKGHAARMVELTKRIDVSIAEITKTVDAMRETERLLHAELRRAGEPYGARHGQAGLANLAMEIVAASNEPAPYMRPAHGVEHWARVGWGHLLDDAAPDAAVPRRLA